MCQWANIYQPEIQIKRQSKPSTFLESTLTYNIPNVFCKQHYNTENNYNQKLKTPA